MSTSGTTTFNEISSILLAMRRMPRKNPTKILEHLEDPVPSDDYHYLDALAALCTFAGPCDSASAVVEYGETSTVLYLAASPSPDLHMRNLLPVWIDLMQKVNGQVSDVMPFSGSEAKEEVDLEVDVSTTSSNAVSDDLKPWERDYTPLENTLIVEVYRACHAKLMDVVSTPIQLAEMLKEEVSDLDPITLRQLKITGTPLVQKLDVLTSVAEKRDRGDALSAEDILSLHCAAGTVAWFREEIPMRRLAPLYDAAHYLSHSVHTLIQFASSPQYRTKIGLPWTVFWVDVPECTDKFLATTNAQELAAIVTQKASTRDELVSVFNEWEPFESLQTSPSNPGDVHTVDGSPGYLTGNGVVHSEAALLAYLYRNGNVAQAVEPYLGCSRPICYPCLMLVDACTPKLKELDVDVKVGHRCIDFRKVDVAWAYPGEMGPDICENLVFSVSRDFTDLCTQREYNPCRPILVLDEQEDLT